MQLVLFASVFFRFLVGVSRSAGDVLLTFLSLLLQNFVSPELRCPKSVDTAASYFNLSGHLTRYACCLTCHAIYKPKFKRGSKIPIYPTRCTHREYRGGNSCGTPLLHGVQAGAKVLMRPIKSFLYHDFKDFVHSLDSRVDLRNAMDKVCDDAVNSWENGEESTYAGPFQSDFLREELKGHDGSTHFVKRPHGEGRYVFSLNMDFFNVEGMRIRGASTSCGIIAMSCLNLPIELRYKPENMYLAGIIPGPHEPRGTQLNHYLEPLIEDLHSAYTRGIKFMYGTISRVVRCALACVVCDLPAARKVAGFQGVTAKHICTVCDLHGKEHYGAHDFEFFGDSRRKPAEWREKAEEWRDATTSRRRGNLTNSYGARWSPLWRLPYWNPVRQLVIDPMHCLLEGLVKKHFRYILGLTASEAERADSKAPAFVYDFTTIPEEDEDPNNPIFNSSSKDYFIDHPQRVKVSKIHEVLTSSLDDDDDDDPSAIMQKKLMRFNLAPLKFVCRSLGFDIPDTAAFRKEYGRKTKVDWVSFLVSWVSLVISLRRL